MAYMYVFQSLIGIYWFPRAYEPEGVIAWQVFQSPIGIYWFPRCGLGIKAPMIRRRFNPRAGFMGFPAAGVSNAYSINPILRPIAQKLS
ncbi:MULTISPECIES: hypothetical protein [unclassified Microcoleus]|uniref:hypothetical protein n=1 Tax=unclassified Microcoleus TaxID=2642155 RepID=UPI0025E17B78|nr:MULTISPECIES: hypothetical protein [unclassified Microcoleus]